jgi:ribose transport system substrate-binding protein
MNALGFFRVWRVVALGLLLVVAVPAATGRGATLRDPYLGPADGPRAQPRAAVVFVAGDLGNSDIAAVARGVQQAATTIGWSLRVVDGEGTPSGERRAMRTALRAKPGGIILGGFDASTVRAVLRRANAAGVPVVGWHAAPRPGPDRADDVYTNVAANPGALARVTARYLGASASTRTGIVIFADPNQRAHRAVSASLTTQLRRCRRCVVLNIVYQPLATAAVSDVTTVTELLHHYGGRFGYLLAVDDAGADIEGARTALVGAGRKGTQPPFLISVGGGDQAEFTRITAGDYQIAAIAEPLTLQGWQLIDELNRARARQAPSGYVAPPKLITKSDVPAGASFDPSSDYRSQYRRIWGR